MRPSGPRVAWAGPLLASALLALAPPARGDFDVADEPPLAPSGRPRFEADAATFLGASGPEIVLAMQVPYRELFFQPSDKGYRARFDLLLVLYEGKRQVAGDLWPVTVDVAKKRDTRSATTFFRKSLRLPAPAGRLRAEATLREPETGRQSQLQWNVTVPDYESSPLGLSTLWVVSCARSDSAAPSSEADLSLSARIPPDEWVLGHRYGELAGPLCVVGEIYRRAMTDAVDLTWKVLDGRRAEVQRGTLRLTGGERIPFRVRPDHATLWLGLHTLEVEAKCGEARARRRFDFQMEHTAVSLRANNDESLEVIRLIADGAEVDSIEALDGLARREAWNRFWVRRDPSPGTPDNEFRDQFFARVQYANENFSVLEPGWRSDRGRTYILHGPPDTIEEHPHEIDGPAYVVWLYERRNRRFVFVDYDGFGRFEFYRPGR